MKKKATKYSKAAAKRLIDRMLETNREPGAIYELYPDDTPHPSTVWRWKHKYEEFAEELNIAYTTIYMLLSEKLDKIGETPSSVLYPDLPFNEAEATAKRHVDVMKFKIAKLAPTMSRIFNPKAKVEVEHKGDAMAQIAIINYAPEKLELAYKEAEDDEE